VTTDPRVLVAVDLGTSAAKAGVVAPDGRLRGFARIPYALLLDGAPAPLWLVWLIIAVTPAVCEEFFFRGLVLSGLRRLGLWPALIACALLFGLAHSSIYRLLPTFFIGLLLSWLVWKTGSIWTGIVAHALNNGIAATLVYNKTLAAAFGAGTQTYLGWKPTLAAVVVLAAGLVVLRGVAPLAATRSRGRSSRTDPPGPCAGARLAQR